MYRAHERAWFARDSRALPVAAFVAAHLLRRWGPREPRAGSARLARSSTLHPGAGRTNPRAATVLGRDRQPLGPALRPDRRRAARAPPAPRGSAFGGCPCAPSLAWAWSPGATYRARCERPLVRDTRPPRCVPRVAGSGAARADRGTFLGSADGYRAPRPHANSTQPRAADPGPVRLQRAGARPPGADQRYRRVAASQRGPRYQPADRRRRAR